MSARHNQLRYKGVVIILDGLADRPVPALESLTPLEAAVTPNLDYLAASGASGLVLPVPKGLSAHTHFGVGQLFGLQAAEVAHLERGPAEAAGLGLPLRPGEVVLRANLATLERAGTGFHILDRRAGRIDEQVADLALALTDLDLGEGVSASFHRTEQHRGALVLSPRDPLLAETAATGEAWLSPEISDTDPGDVETVLDVRACLPREASVAAARTARLINHFTGLSFSLLEEHPVNQARRQAGLVAANGVILRGAGRLLPIEHQLAQTLRIAVVAGCSTVLGLARMFGFSVVHEPGFTADQHTDLKAKIGAVRAALATHDLVYLHIKGTDVLAHDRQPLAKRDFLERLDSALAPLLFETIVIAVCADHGTDSNSGRHIDDPVPGLLQVPGASGHSPEAATQAQSEAAFNERNCREGSLGTLDGHQFLDLVLDAMRSGTR